MQTKVVLVEDEDHIRRAVKTILTDDGYEVFEADCLKAGKIECACRRPDLIIVDLGLPDGDGLDLISDVRTYSSIPIIVLSARDTESSKVMALDCGADDYLTKPFGQQELKARIRAQLRRFNTVTKDGDNSDVINLSPSVKVDLVNHLVYKNDQDVHLTKLEFKLLQVLIKDANKVLTQHYLMQNVWGANYVEHQHYLRIYMNHLRQKLEDDPANPQFLITETGIGYRLMLG